MVSNWQINCLVKRIDALKAEIIRVKTKEHPYTEPLIIYSALLSVLDRHKKMFEEQIKFFSKRKKAEFLEEYCETLAIDLYQVEKFFSIVDRVDSSRIPFEILRALSWAAQELVNIKCKIVVRLDPVINYSILSTKRVFETLGWKDDLKKAKDEFNFKDDDILLLGIPSTYSNSVLLNALAPHEFGHLLFHINKNELNKIIDKVYQEVQDKRQYQLQDYMENLTSRSREKVSDTYSYNKTVEEVSHQLIKTAINWCAEVYSDLVGARLLGAAFLASFDRVLVGNHSPSLSHPPNQLRREIIKSFIDNSNPKLNSDKIWRLLKNDKQDQPWNDDPFWAFEKDVCLTIVPYFTETLQQISSPFDNGIEEVNKIIEDIQTHIEHLSPPSVAFKENEMWMNAKGFWIIFYAAWCFLVNRERFDAFSKRYLEQNQLADGEVILGNLVLQSLKALELNVQWLKEKKELEREEE